MNKLLIQKVKELTINTVELAQVLGVSRDKAHDIVKFIKESNKKNYRAKSNLPDSVIFTSDLFAFLGLNIQSIKTCKEAVYNNEIDTILEHGLYNTVEVQKLLGYKRFETAKKRIYEMRDLNPFYYKSKKILKDTEVSAIDIIKYYGFNSDDIYRAISYYL